MDKDQVLDEIFNSDPFGLLEVKPANNGKKSPDERLSSSFMEIEDFFEKNRREPEPNTANVAEFQLYSRLKNLRDDPEKLALCEPLDSYGLLKAEKKEINTIDDIFNDDSLGILEGDPEGLFVFNHTPKEDTRAQADYVANRKPCKKFDAYEPLFHKIQQELASGARKLITFSELNLTVGNFYVLNGILLYLEKADLDRTKQDYRSGLRIRKDGRTRCIFENGTESNMLYRSLYKALLDNGRTVTRTPQEEADELTQNAATITGEDKETGFIYILSSLGSNPDIKEIANLYKIGYSTIPIEERVKNAVQEPAYLMAPVKVLATFRCYNLNPQKFEQLIHNFFGKVCLDIDIFDTSGKRHMPREWFIVPIEVIEQAIELIISGEIIDYRYDEVQEIIIRK